MSNKPFDTYQFKVKENNHEMTVIIPKSDDRSYDKYLIEAETEKTRNELRNKPKRIEKPHAREDLVGIIKERQQFNRRKAHTVNKRYY